MLCYPRPGQIVRIHYGKQWRRDKMPFHDRTGVVRICARRPGPLNHGIEIDGEIIVIPCGNLMKGEQSEQ